MMINYFVHVGLPLPQITSSLQSLFKSRADIRYLNALPDDIASCLGRDMLMMRRQCYPVAPFASPVMQRLKAMAPRPDAMVGFSLPDFLLAAPEEVDLITRAHRLYDHLFFGVQVIIVIANQLDFIRIDYARRYAAGEFTGSLDDYVALIMGQKYYGLAVDLRYDHVYHALAAFFGHGNCLIIPAEEALANPGNTCRLLMQKVNIQAGHGESHSSALPAEPDDAHYAQFFPKNLGTDSLPQLSERSRALIWECFAPGNAAFLNVGLQHIFSMAFKAHGYPL